MPLWLSGSVAVVVRETACGDEVLLVQRADTREWAPVAGVIDPGEQPHEAAIREVKEEASVTATVDRLVWLTVTDMVTYENGDQTQYIDHVFRCTWVSGEPTPGDGEALQARFFPLTALPTLSEREATRLRVGLENRPEAYLGPLPTDPTPKS